MLTVQNGNKGTFSIWNRNLEITGDFSAVKKDQVSSYKYEGPSGAGDKKDRLVPCSFEDGEAVRRWVDNGSLFRSQVFGSSDSEHEIALGCNLGQHWYLAHGGEPETAKGHDMVNHEL